MSSELILRREQWRDVQAELKRLKFYFGVVDGLRGPLTNAAIVAFKRSIGFAARPFFGPLTFDALFPKKVPQEELPWMANARAVMGLHERTHNTKLREWFGDFIASWVDPKEISWCGAFVAVCFKRWETEIEVPGNVLGARQWGNFGEACTPQRGAVLTFWRGSKSGWQGHVGFMVGQDASTYHILGGNQSDAVTITRLQKSRFLNSRWPKGHPQTNDPAWGTLAGAISYNEA